MLVLSGSAGEDVGSVKAGRHADTSVARCTNQV